MTEEVTEYDALVREYRTIAGPLEYLVDHVQDSIELEHFSATKAGKLLIGRALNGARAALVIILDPSASPDTVTLAVAELRVQHRVLECFRDIIASGKQAAQVIDESTE